VAKQDPQNSAPDTADQPDNHRARVAGGAGFAFIGRLGALIEAGSMIAFTWMYGTATFGLFAALWAYVKVSTAITDVAMTTAMQRYVPRASADGANMIVGFALKLSFLVGCVFALAGTIAAPWLASYIHAAESDAARLVTVIQIYVWVLPFWTMVEVGTAAIRARRTFGPEIKVRIFYEQGIRLVTATVFAAVGMLTYGLFIAHLVSVVLAAALALRLVSKYYDLAAVWRAPLSGPIARELLHYGVSVMPANISKMLFSEFPVMFLNFMLPGAAGAAASGFYAVARKIASALQTVRLTFEYVIAPLAAERDGHGDHPALQEMYAFATRLSLCIALPFGAALILARHDLLAAMKPEFAAASAAIAILSIGRIVEAATGPATAIIESLGHKALPALNGIIGFAVLVGLGLYLIPLYGVTGAAVAASVGLNVTAIISLVQSALLYKLSPYDRHLLRPLGAALVLTTVMAAFIPASTHWPAPTGIIFALSALFVMLAVLVRYGLSEEDAAALGPLGKFLRP
jgi:O-antigen/teichoic acid export membrane protein